VRTNLSTTETNGKGRRGSVATTLAIFGMALPLSGLLGGTAFAAADAAEAAALRLAADKGNTTAQAASVKNDDATGKPAVLASSAANKPADFIGPVAPAKKDDTAAAAKAAGPNSNTSSKPFTNAGGVTTGSNTTKYEVVNGRDGSPAVGGGQPSGNVQSAQPFSNADKNNTGANDTSTTNPYRSTRDGAPSLNGNGGGQQVGQPCAGCVGKADNKNPGGQAPNATDRNAGYECDRNHGIGRSNPAHTGCTTTPTVCVPTKDQDANCKPIEKCVPKTGEDSNCKPIVKCVPKTGEDSNCKPIVKCVPKTGEDSNCKPIVKCVPKTGEDSNCKPIVKCVPKTGEDSNCKPIVKCVPVGNQDSNCNPPKDCLGVVNGNATAADCTKNELVDCKGVVNGTATAKDCTPPVGCPAAGMVGPVVAGCRPPSTPIDGGNAAPETDITGSTPGQPVLRPNGATPPVLVNITGSPEAPAQGPNEAPGALPFTGTDALLLAQLAALMLLVGGGLVGMSRKKKVLATV